jgi:hypothetical protein
MGNIPDYNARKSGRIPDYDQRNIGRIPNFKTNSRKGDLLSQIIDSAVD